MKYALLILMFCVPGVASERSDESCKVTIKKDNGTVFKGTVGIQQIGTSGRFRLMFYDSDKATFYYDEGTPIEYTGKDVEEIKADFCVPYFGEEVCSKVKKITAFEPDNEDAPAIIHYLDENGSLLGRVGGFPGLASVCK